MSNVWLGDRVPMWHVSHGMARHEYIEGRWFMGAKWEISGKEKKKQKNFEEKSILCSNSIAEVVILFWWWCSNYSGCRHR